MVLGLEFYAGAPSGGRMRFWLLAELSAPGKDNIDLGYDDRGELSSVVYLSLVILLSAMFKVSAFEKMSMTFFILNAGLNNFS